MNLINIDEFLNNNGLKMPNLEALVPDAKPYKSLLLQPCGEIEVGNYFVRNTNRKLAHDKHTEFFNCAYSKNVQIAITPEYSCPMSVLESLLEGEIYPTEKNIWVIGSESINQQEFLELTIKCNDIGWLYEEELFTCIEEDKFLDPVFYLFQTRCKLKNTLKRVVVVQFKTNPMADNFERDRLLEGQALYIIRNNEASINLVTIICSDALEFDINNHFNIHLPYLLIHIQLNKEPFNPMFSNYRRNCYLINKLCNKDIITLNWSRKTKLIGAELKFGGSALYTKASNVNLDDVRINENHRKGLYYAYLSTLYTNVFYLNYDEYIFMFENTKVSQCNASPQNQNSSVGPIMKTVLKWSNNSSWLEEYSVNDYFKDICDEADIDFFSLVNDKIEPINIERLVSLSIGYITESKQKEPKNMKYFKIDNDTNEVIKRLTVTQHPNSDINQFKIASLIKFSRLFNVILANKQNIPSNIKDLKDNYEIKYLPTEYETSYYFNVYSKDKNTPATVIFLGYKSSSDANGVLDKICNSLSSSQSDYRVVIWYEDATGLKSLYNSNKPKISKSKAIKRNSYRKGE